MLRHPTTTEFGLRADNFRLAVHDRNMRGTAKALLGIAAVVGAVLIYNVGLYIFTGMPYIPAIENRWWAGFYDTSNLGRQWCVAVFDHTGGDGVRLAVLSRTGPPNVFSGGRDSSDQSFVTYELRDESGILRIEAKQLYEGKRYILQRLSAGRFTDFWEMNEDLSIRGRFVWADGSNDFAIELLPAERVDEFWNKDVRRIDGLSPRELLSSTGFKIPQR